MKYILNYILKYKVYILFILIVLVSAYLRFHRLGDIYVFNLDEEYQAEYAWLQILDPHPIWIGLIASALEFYVGPYLVYFTAILLALSKGDPIITAYFAAFLGVVTTVVIFYVGKQIFSLTTAIVAAALYGTLPLFVFFDQKYWNPMFGPLISVLLLFSLVKIKQSKWWWVLFAASAGAIFETHLPSFPLLVIGAWYFLKGNYWKDLKLLFICILVFLLSYWPLIIFDLNHNFSNLGVITRVFNGNSQSNLAFGPIAKFKTLFDSLGRFWYLKAGSPNADEINFGCSTLSLSTGYQMISRYTERTYSPIWLSLFSLITLLLFLARNLASRIFAYKILALFLTISAVFFLLYKGGSYEYYILNFLALFTFIPALAINYLKGRLRLLAIGFLIIAMIFGINSVLSVSDNFSLKPKRAIIDKVMGIVGNEPFSIEGRGICHNYEGWRYLFKVYGKSPVQSYTDNSLGWLYPKEISHDKPTYTIILSEDRIPLTEDLSGIPSVKEGGYRAYIRKNKHENSISK